MALRRVAGLPTVGPLPSEGQERQPVDLSARLGSLCQAFAPPCVVVRAAIVPFVAVFLYGVYCIALVHSPPAHDHLSMPQLSPDYQQVLQQHDWMTSEQHDTVLPLWETASRIARNGTVIMAMANAGYEDLLENFVTSLSRLDLAQHLIIFCSDSTIQEFAESKWPGHSVLLRIPSQLGMPPIDNISHAHDFGSRGFYQVSASRCTYMQYLLSFGFNVLYSDIDMAWVQSPLPFFSRSSDAFEWYGAQDFIIRRAPNTTKSQEFYQALKRSKSRLYICAGFLFLRSTPGTKALVGNWAYRLAFSGIEGGVTDQDHLDEVVKWMDGYNMLPRLGVLPPHKFPSGQVTRLNWCLFEKWRDEIVVFHANYVVGRQAKIDLFKKAGFWMLQGGGMQPPAAAEAEAASAATAAGAGGATESSGSNLDET